MTVKQFKSDEIAKLHEDQSVKQTVVNTANNSGAIYGVLTG